MCIHTHRLGPRDLLTLQEKVTGGAAEEVFNRICSVSGGIWVGAFDPETKDSSATLPVGPRSVLHSSS